MNMVLRAATDEDYEVVCTLYDQLEQIHAQALPHFFRTVEGHARPHKWFADILANEDAALFVAEQQGIIVGMVHCYVRITPGLPMIVPRRFVHVEDLVVSEPVRHQGVGQLLTERVNQWSLEKGIREIELDVWEFPTSALAFYEKLGYETTRRHMRKLLP
ncbi:MAG TPA: GNAT family N-acetyltransferase [Ktedonosporobacter sp.]|nr:GNAT family N-acetyltransferase [Ktedonosporobacter sp.]